ncbi:MAG TPA: hypothetical protein VFV98_04885 [Vicinamibacterales bacterium]|nr:hypothetical protein [Vicinamibacterales bacterium]
MKRHDVMMRTVLFGLTLMLATPALAQQVPPLPAPGSLPDDPVKPQVILFESALRQSIDGAGQKLAERAAQIEPRLVLAPDRLAEVRGIHLDDLFYFDILIPDLNPVAMRVMSIYRQQQTGNATPVAVPTNPAPDKIAATSSGATKVVEPDEMKVTAPTLATFDPTRDYSAFSRDAIMNALLDLSGVLPVKEQDKVTISASGFPIMGGNPLYPQSNRKLVVTIKGSDLIELRQGKISRDEAKSRIKESRY